MVLAVYNVILDNSSKIRIVNIFLYLIMGEMDNV